MIIGNVTHLEITKVLIIKARDVCFVILANIV